MKNKNEFQIFCLFVKMIAKLIPREFILLLIFSILSGGMTAISVWVWKILYDVSSDITNSDFDLSMFIYPCVLILCILLIKYLMSVLKSRYVVQIEESIRIKLLSEFYDDINRVPADRFSSGSFYDSIQRVQGFISGNRFTLLIKRVFLIIQSVVTCVSVSAVIISYHYSLVILCAVSILPPAVFRIMRGKRYYYLAKFQTSDKRRLGYYFSLLTSPRSLKELRTYNACSYVERKRHEVQNKLHKEESEFIRKNGIIQLFVDTSRTLGVGIGILTTGVLVVLGKVDIGVFASSISAFENLQRAFSTILITFGLIDVELLNFKEFVDFEEALPKEKVYSYTDKFIFKKAISFRDVTYIYPGQEKNVIDHINVEIKKGELVAVFGLNGAGKSTFAKLLLGIYSPTAGEIFADGVPMAEYVPASVYKEMSAVFQDFVKYKFSLKNNIVLGCVDKINDEETIQDVIMASGMDDVISVLENGAETQLGTEFGGVELSGGQWQRIAIARAMMKDSSIIVLDEPTSAIDPLEEYSILSKFKKMAENKTAIVISHRVSLSRIADKILFFKEGKIVESGTHNDLLAKRGEYYELYEKQSSLYL